MGEATEEAAAVAVERLLAAALDAVVGAPLGTEGTPPFGIVELAPLGTEGGPPFGIGAVRTPVRSASVVRRLGDSSRESSEKRTIKVFAQV